MLITDLLKQTEKFSVSEKTIAQYILDNPRKISKLTIYDLAESTFTSVSTVSRLCKKVGLKSFKDFQLTLNSEISSFNTFSERIEYDFPIQNEKAILDIISKVLHLHIQTLNDTINNLDLNALEQIAQLLMTAQSIEIFAESNSYSVATSLYNRLVWLEMKANLDGIPGNQFLKAKTLDESSVVIIVSYYGKSNTLNRIADHLIEKNIKFILLTGPKESTLQKKSFCSLQVTPTEDKYKKVASFGSDIALYTVIDILTMQLYSKKTGST